MIEGPSAEVIVEPLLQEGPAAEVIVEPLGTPSTQPTPAAYVPPETVPERTATDDLLEGFEPWMTSDLRDYLTAAGGTLAEVELYSSDTDDGHEGWTLLLDVDRCPQPALPYLAQFVGEVLPRGIAEQAGRQWVRDAPNERRGTLAAIIAAAQRYLTGQRTVTVIERENNIVDAIGVLTYAQETPDSDAVLRELQKVVPADVILNYRVSGGQTWNDVNTANASWNALTSQKWSQVATKQTTGTTGTA